MSNLLPDPDQEAALREDVARFWFDRVCPASFVGRWDDAKQYPGMLAELVAETYEDADAIIAGPLAPPLARATAAEAERDEWKQLCDDGAKVEIYHEEQSRYWEGRFDAAEATLREKEAEIAALRARLEELDWLLSQDDMRETAQQAADLLREETRGYGFPNWLAWENWAKADRIEAALTQPATPASSDEAS